MKQKNNLTESGISIVLGSYNRLSFLKLTIDSLRAELESTKVASEIIVVDGGSTDGSIDWLCRQKDIITIVQYNRGEWKGKPLTRKSWGYFMNLAFKSARGKYICMVSDDCLVVPGSISNGYKYFEKKLKEGRKVGALAFYWRNWPEQDRYWVGLTLGEKIFVNHGMYLRSALEEVDFIDEVTYMFYHADGDLCLKLWNAGFECIDSPDSYIEHYSHANLKARKSNNTLQSEDWESYIKKWRDIFQVETNKDWIEKTYSDPFRTGEGFRKYYIKHRIFRKRDIRAIMGNIKHKILK